jgi:hypothetical protein
LAASIATPSCVTQLLQRPSTASGTYFFACIAGINALTAILTIRATDAFSFTTLTDLLEIWWDDEHAFYARVVTSCTGIVECVLDKGTPIVSYFEAVSAASELRMPVCQLVDC